MADNPTAGPSFLTKIKESFTDPRNLFYVLLAVVLGFAGAAAGWKLYIKPIRATADIQYRSHECLMRLYDLQMAYHGAHGTYAGDLDTLLASASDGAQLREKLKASVDINTLAVVGDASRFRLEINVLDPQRTSVKIRGPLGRR